jgi:hypothetical protein
MRSTCSLAREGHRPELAQDSEPGKINIGFESTESPKVGVLITVAASTQITIQLK